MTPQPQVPSSPRPADTQLGSQRASQSDAPQRRAQQRGGQQHGEQQAGGQWPPAAHQRGPSLPEPSKDQRKRRRKAERQRREAEMSKYVERLPEAMRYAMICWLGLVVAEAAHQVMNLVMSLMNRAELREEIRDSLGQTQVSDSILGASVVLSVVFMSLAAFALVGVLWWLASLVSGGTKRAPLARRLLMYVTIYLCLRGVMLFFAQPTGSLPVGLYVVDGCFQLAAGVFAALAMVFSSQKEAVDYIHQHVPPQDKNADDAGSPKDHS